MNISKKFFLVGALLCSALLSRSQTFPELVNQRDLLNDACGKKGNLPFSMPTLNLQEDVASLRKLGCNYAMGPSLPKEIADEMKFLIEGTAGFKSSKNLRCDFLQPFDLKALFNEREQQSLDQLINETFHR